MHMFTMMFYMCCVPLGCGCMWWLHVVAACGLTHQKFIADNNISLYWCYHRNELTELLRLYKLK